MVGPGVLLLEPISFWKMLQKSQEKLLNWAWNRLEPTFKKNCGSAADSPAYVIFPENVQWSPGSSLIFKLLRLRLGKFT
jgi:hypothetical protein